MVNYVEYISAKSVIYVHNQLGKTNIWMRGISVFLDFFRSDTGKQRDIAGIRNLYARYGDDYIDILKQRAGDRTLDKRSHRHWKRLYHRAVKDPDIVK